MSKYSKLLAIEEAIFPAESHMYITRADHPQQPSSSHNTEPPKRKSKAPQSKAERKAEEGNFSVAFEVG